MANLLGGAVASEAVTDTPITSFEAVPDGYVTGYINAFATVSWTGTANAYVLGRERRVLVPTEIRFVHIPQED